jgi:23S rRNA (uracil1939-C5)-methyltransferase
MENSMNLEQKQAMVEELVKKNHLPIEVGPIHSAALDKHYRNKVIVAFAKHKGRVYAGQYAPHSHRVIKDGGRSLQPKIINDIIDTITALVQEYGPCTQK